MNKKPLRLSAENLLVYSKNLDMIPNWYTNLTQKVKELYNETNMGKMQAIKVAAALLAYPMSEKQELTCSKLTGRKKHGFIMTYLIVQAYRKKDLIKVIEKYLEVKDYLSSSHAKVKKEADEKKALFSTLTNIILDSLVVNYTVRTEGLKRLLED